MHTDIGNLKLRGARLLVDRPKPWESQERKVGDSGLYAPQQALHNGLGWAVKAKVLAVGPKVTGEIQVGDEVITDAFSGRPIYDQERELDLWLLGESEVMAVIEGGSTE